MQLHHLKAFVVLAKELNYRRAAECLALTQPGLSEQVRQLERELGLTLFDRDRSGTRLSPAGRNLLPLAMSAAESVDHLVAAAHAQEPRGFARSSAILRVGIVVDGIGDRTWPLLRAFHELRPDVRIDVRSLNFFEASDAIDRGTVDVIMKMGPTSDSDLQEVVTVAYHPMSAMVPMSSSLARDETVELELVARGMTFETPVELGKAYSKHWTLQSIRDAAPSNRLSTLRAPKGNPGLVQLVQQFMAIGGAALWPTGLPAPPGTDCVLVALDRPFESPREIVINRRSDHARALAIVAQAL